LLQLDLQLQDDGGGDISSFITNGEWDLLGRFENLTALRTKGNFLSSIFYHSAKKDQIIFISTENPLLIRYSL